MQMKDMPEAIKLFNDFHKINELLEVIANLEKDNFKTGRLLIKDSSGRSSEIILLNKEDEISLFTDLKEALKVIRDNNSYKLKKY